MATQHVCRERPGFKEGDDPWAEGPVHSCPHHSKQGRKQPKVKGIGSRSDDMHAGVIGVDRGGFISGT